ncbi:hypothetical protein PanWU01x14_350010 [Parasponia andersonii]|uniref:Uncharacterized protein n=1 Tax=Parasponia andersonii TaxID=3476 RepID=A0A2P5AB43_PARAD|nr:hypothetical protein PanWU01x14_350010 [Parasponia andersonii]
MGVWMGITFVTLVDKLYEVIGDDKNHFDLELKVIYKYDGGDGIPIPPTKITTDSDLEIWLEEMSYSIQNRTPLCVSILPKLTPVGEGCSQNASFVPETGTEKIDELKECFNEIAKTLGTTGGTSSSRVRRIRIVDNEAKWSAPLFSEGELLQGTHNNLSVGSSNSVKIMIGQLFENKEDLKLKLHLHAMKCNFEFKMSDFLHYFEKIKVKDQAIANYLEEIGIEKWSCANFSAIRYNIMTSNKAESFNNTSRDA